MIAQAFLQTHPLSAAKEKALARTAA